MKKILLIIGGLITATSMTAQYNTIGFYDSHFTFSKAAFNPSKLGDNDAKIEMNVLPNLYFYAGNSLMPIDHILYPTTAKLDETIGSAAEASRVGMGLEIPFVSFSYKITPKDKELLTVGLTTKTRVLSDITLGGNLLRLMWNGNKQFAGQTVDLGAFQMNAFSTTEIGLTLAAPFKIGNTTIRWGGSFKYLMSLGGINLPQTTSTFTTGPEGRSINLNLDYQVQMAVTGDGVLFPGKGFGFDLGATTEIGENTYASASVLDIGSITYSSNTTSYQFSGDLDFEGVELDNLFEENSIKPDSVFLEKLLVDKDSGQSFSIDLPTRFVLQVEKHFGATTTKKGKAYNKHGVYLTYIQGFKNVAGASTQPYTSLGYSYSLKEMLNVGPTVNYSKYTGLGAGMFLSVKVRHLRLGVGSNSALSYLLATNKARGVDASFTTSFVFGKRKKKVVEDPLETPVEKTVENANKKTVEEPVEKPTEKTTEEPIEE